MANGYLRALRELHDISENASSTPEQIKQAEICAELAFLAHQKELAALDEQNAKETQGARKK